MNRGLHMRAITGSILVAGLLATLAATAQTVQPFRVTMTAALANGTVINPDLEFGLQAAAATDAGFDDGLDMTAPPACPAPYQDVYFYNAQSSPARLRKDFRAVAQPKQWTLKIDMSPNTTVNLAWVVPAGLGGTLALKEGTTQIADMKTQSTLQVTTSKTYTIVYSLTAEQVRITKITVDGDDKVIDSVVSVAIAATGNPLLYRVASDQTFATVVQQGDLTPGATAGNYLIPDLNIGGVATVSGKKTLYFKLANATTEATMTKIVTVSPPTIASAKVNGNNQSGSLVSNTLKFKATGARQYRITAMLDQAKAYALGELVPLSDLPDPDATGTYTIPDLDFTDVQNVSGKRTISVYVSNDYSEVARPAVVIVTFAAPKLTKFQIAAGAKTIAERSQASLDHTVSGRPTEYRVHNALFTPTATDAVVAWEVYPEDGLLTYYIDGAGTTVTLWFQVKNELGISNVLSDSIAVDPVWAGTWTGEYLVTANSDATAEGYIGEMEKGRMIVYMVNNRGTATVTIPLLNLTFKTTVNAATGVIAPVTTKDKAGDNVTIDGTVQWTRDSGVSMALGFAYSNAANTWQETVEANLTRVDGATVPDIAGIWILEQIEIIQAGWVNAPPAALDLWYMADEFTSTPYTFLEIKGKAKTATGKDIVGKASYKGAIEGDGSDNALFTFANAAAKGGMEDYLSGVFVAGDTELSGDSFYTLPYKSGTTTGENTLYSQFVGQKYTGTEDIADGTSNWDVVLTPNTGTATQATAAVTIKARAITIVLRPATGAAVTLKGSIYDGRFAAKGGAYELHGLITDTATVFTGAFNYRSGTTHAEGTAEWSPK